MHIPRKHHSFTFIYRVPMARAEIVELYFSCRITAKEFARAPRRAAPRRGFSFVAKLSRLGRVSRWSGWILSVLWMHRDGAMHCGKARRAKIAAAIAIARARRRSTLAPRVCSFVPVGNSLLIIVDGKKRTSAEMTTRDSAVHLFNMTI